MFATQDLPCYRHIWLQRAFQPSRVAAILVAHMPRHTPLATALRDHALALPEAWADQPWEGDHVAKVGKKIFAFLAADDAGTVALKLPASAGLALTLACARPTPYGLGRHGWVTLRLADPSLPDVTLLRDWIEESYRAVAPKRLSVQLTASDHVTDG